MNGFEVDRERGVAIKWDASDYAFSFWAKEIVETTPSDEALYYLAGASDGMDSTPDFDKGDNLVEGSIKWDGCSHFYFGEADNAGYLHICGMSSFAQLEWTLAKLRELAAMHIRGFSPDVAGWNRPPR